MHTTSIRPALCITPPPSLPAELLQLQPLPAQATSACKLLPCQIIVKVYPQPAEGLALTKERMLGIP